MIPVVVITPVKNEAKYIEQTIASVLAQTCLPSQWIIVDDGSTDNTASIVSKYVGSYPWMTLLRINNSHEERKGGSKVVRAFNYGYTHESRKDFEYIVKLDGDLILPVNYFETILKEFSDHEELGMCGGYIINRFSEKDERVEASEEYHVRGALKMLRKACWEEIGGFKEVWNWDGLDVMEARFRGWDTRSINIPVIHLRPTSSAYNSLEHAYTSGYEAYKMGADFFLTLIRMVFKMKNKPFFKAGVLYYKGYIKAKKNKEKLVIPKQLAEFINREHYKRLNIFKKKKFISNGI